MNSTWGTKITYSLFGESHGRGVGITIHGLRAGIELPYAEINKMLISRSTGSDIVSGRSETDEYQVLSGVLNGYTTGAPVTFFIENKDAKSKDYSEFRDKPRPSHSDYVNTVVNGKYADINGAGHFSGRLTAPIVIAGAILLKELEKEGICIVSRLKSVMDIDDDVRVKPSDVDILKSHRIRVLDDEKRELVEELIRSHKDVGDTLGCLIETSVFGLRAGIGSPFFHSVESVLSGLLFSVPAVKSVSFGLGEDFARRRGSEVNDEFVYEHGTVKTKTNNSGGINAGISNGMDIVINTAIRPAASIGMEQNTISLKTQDSATITIGGRHDTLIGVRACPVIESVVAMGIYDMLQ